MCRLEACIWVLFPWILQTLLLVESFRFFLNNKSGSNDRLRSKIALRQCFVKITSKSTSKTSLSTRLYNGSSPSLSPTSQQQQLRHMARRWNGNFKQTYKLLKDIPTSKAMRLNVTAACGSTKTLKKKRMESLQHVLTKAVIWKLFMNEYSRMEIEYDIGDPANYVPDVVGWKTDHEDGPPQFWGESGRMKPHKALDLMQRYPHAHIVHCRWGMKSIDEFAQPMLKYLSIEMEEGRLDPPLAWWNGKFTFALLPLDVWRFIDNKTGEILVSKDDLVWRELDVSTIVVRNGESST
jgi:hypothetical protein